MSTVLSILAASLPSLLPRPFCHPADWAAENIRLPADSSSEPGRYDPSRIPGLRWVMDQMVDDTCELIDIIKPAQYGITQGLVAIFGWIIDCAPGPILDLHPVDKSADTFIREQWRPTVRLSARLSELVEDSHDRKNDSTMTEQMFPGGHINIATGNTEVAYRQSYFRYTFLDDFDSFPKVIPGQGAPRALAASRTTTALGRKNVVASSPNGDEAQSEIWKTWEIPGGEDASGNETMLPQSTQTRVHWACPHCGVYQPFDLPHVRVQCGLFTVGLDKIEPYVKSREKEIFLANDPTDAWYECPHCAGTIRDYHKRGLIQTERYVDANPGHRHRCILLTGLQSTFYRFVELARDFRAGLLADDLNPFYNTKIGIPAPKNQIIFNEQKILLLRDGRPEGLVPEDCLCLLATVDTQMIGYYVSVFAVGYASDTMKNRHYLLRYRYCRTDAERDEMLFTDRYLDRNGAEYTIFAGAIDTGGGEAGGAHFRLNATTRTEDAYNFCRLHRNFLAFKGSSSATPIPAGWKESDLDKMPSGRVIPGRLRLYLIETQKYKNLAALQISVSPEDQTVMHLPAGAPGSLNLHQATDLDYTRQLVSEYINKAGRWTCPKHKPNHYWDNLVSLHALCDILGTKYKRRPTSDDVGAPHAAPSPRNPNVKVERESRWG